MLPNEGYESIIDLTKGFQCPSMSMLKQLDNLLETSEVQAGKRVLGFLLTRTRNSDSPQYSGC
jgi:hypothetical protein